MPESIKPTLVINGTEPGDVIFQLEINSEEPTYEYCFTTTLTDGDLDLTMSPAGLAKFETPEDVEAALAAAFAEAKSEFMGNSPLFSCGEACAYTYGEGDGTEVDATASVFMSWSSIGGPGPEGEGDAACEIDGVPQVIPPTQVEVSVTAPQKPGVDFRPLLAAIDTSKMSASVPSGRRTQILDVLTELLDPATDLTLPVTTYSGDPAVVKVVSGTGNSVRIVRSVSGVTIQIHAGESTGTWTQMSAGYSSATGSWTSGGQVVSFGSKVNDITADLNGAFVYGSISPGMFPSSWSLEAVDNDPLTIDYTFPIGGGDDPNEWIIGDFSLDFTPAGSFLAETEVSRHMIDPGHKPRCKFFVRYDNPNPWLGLGSNKMELLWDHKIPIQFLSHLPCEFCFQANI